MVMVVLVVVLVLLVGVWLGFAIFAGDDVGLESRCWCWSCARGQGESGAGRRGGGGGQRSNDTKRGRYVQLRHSSSGERGVVGRHTRAATLGTQ